MTSEFVSKLRSAKTMPEVDAMRGPIADAMPTMDRADFERVQGEFRKALNRMRRIPRRDRTW